MKIKEHNKPFEESDVLLLEENQFPFSLIVWNDEVNTFDWVIDTLIDICGHDQVQAEQCTLIIHYKGKCAVKSGSFDDLKLMCDSINDRGIGATIEEIG